MEKPGSHAPEQSFIVRISDADARVSLGGWRAAIVHVMSGDRRYVSSYDELCAFIETHRRGQGERA